MPKGRNYQGSAHKGTGRGYYHPCCEPRPSDAVLEQCFARIYNAHPDWTRVRVWQRALVEMYLEKL